MSLGSKRWCIAEGYIPAPGPNAKSDALRSHETACILNAGEQDAHIVLTIYFADREPAGPYRITVPARRTLHLRFNELESPQRVPRETDYSSVFESDQPVVIQHTRLDARMGSISIMTTMACAAD